MNEVLSSFVKMNKFEILVFAVACLCIANCGADKDEGDGVEKMEIPEDVHPEKLEYAKGSVCGYCSYCQFCELCTNECPCETSATKPNCKMCKYCKYCNLCSAVCDTVCTPGGILDRVSGALINSLPTVDHKEVGEDIDSVRHYIKSKEEL